MPEYIERMVAIAEACKGCNEEFSDNPCEPPDCSLQRRLFAIPAADVVEVVRCKNCRYSKPYLHYFYCENDKAPWAENTMANLMDANDFCSYGERKCE